MNLILSCTKEKDTDLLISLLAIWRAGGAYLPLDSEAPDERLRFVLEDADVALVITDGERADRLSQLTTSVLALDNLPNDIEVEQSLPKIELDQLAYIIYTSGSTGQPKGVMVTHGQLAVFNQAIISDLNLDSRNCVLSASAPIFDAFFMDLVAAFGVGGRLVRLQARQLMRPEYLPVVAEQVEATYLDLTPTVWRVALESGFIPSQSMQLVTGGEAISPELAKQLNAQGAKLYNSYGPTEVTVVAIAGDISEENKIIPIGRPLPGTQAYIVDQHLSPVPVGVTGELLLAGAQVARGYLNRPELNAEVFIKDPFSDDARAYRTGDLVRWRQDGQIEYLGRMDDQVKIRGMRVELGEIESALIAIESIEQAVVIADRDAQGQTQLLAYLVPMGQMVSEVKPQVLTLAEVIDLNTLRLQLQQGLPAHMIPMGFIGLDQLPLTPSGKTDRRALPKVEPETANAPYEAPESEVEQALASAIADLLDVDQVGRHDNFFALGGHSLLAVRLLTRQ